MKQVLRILSLVLLSNFSWAKHIRFTVDMTDQLVSPNGVHLTGDFQALLGLEGGDWQSNTLELTQQSDTNMYSVVLNLPAFRKYEYKFVNGDQFYEVEFVPWESRVGYEFNDNRWLYLDSLSSDTTFIGALKFGENAPAGLRLMRFLVDMQQETVSSSGVHVTGDFNFWQPSAPILYSFVSGIYEVIAYAPVGQYNYNFLNGNTLGELEVIADTCATELGYRTLDLQTHTILPTVCFGACEACVVSSVSEEVKQMTLVYPNPTEGVTLFQVPDGHVKEAFLMDSAGRFVMHEHINGSRQFAFDMRSCNAGLYFARLVHFDGHVEVIKVNMK
jgi:hypothetical protein